MLDFLTGKYNFDPGNCENNCSGSCKANCANSCNGSGDWNN